MLRIGVGVVVLALGLGGCSAERTGEWAAAGAMGASERGAAPEDAFAGRWIGMMGPPDDRVELGLEFTRADGGGLGAAVWSPVLNVYGQDIGVATLEGDGLRVEGMGATLRLEGDVLLATLASGGEPVRLARVAELPVEAPVPDLPVGPAVRWQTKLGAPIFAPVEVTGDLAVVGSSGGVVTALRVADGSIAWTFTAGRPVFGQAAAAAGAVFVVCDDGSLYRLDAASGAEAWRYDLGDARVARVLGHPAVFAYDLRGPRPCVDGGVVYVGSGDGSVHAVDAARGERVWSVVPGGTGGSADAGSAADSAPGPAAGKIRGGAACDGERVYVGSTNGHLYALDRATGSTVWDVDLGGDVTGAPVLAGGLLYIGTRRSSSLVALDPATGERRWRRGMFGSWVESEPVVVDGVLYIGSSDLRKVAAYDAVDGRLLWRTDVYGWSWGTPVVVGDVVYAAAAGVDPYMIRHVGGVLGLDRATGRVVWRRPAETTSGTMHSGFVGGPVFAGRLLIVAGMDGCVYAIAVAE